MEALILRAVMALGSGVDEKEIAETFQATGVSAEDTFLAIKAAEDLWISAIEEPL